MANETRTGAPLTATVGERLEEQAHHGDTAGVDRAAAAVEDLRAGGYQEPQRGAARADARREGRGERDRTSAVAWAVAAGLGTWVVAGMLGRAFRR